jgi:putative transposase
MRYDRGIIINKKKVQRIMKLKGWQVKPIKRPSRGAGKFYEKKHKVVNPRDRAESMLPDIRRSTDLTMFYVAEEEWVNFIPVIDCCTRECIGKRISVRGRAREARDALEEAVLTRFGTIQNVPDDLTMRVDNGSIFLSKEYWSEFKRLGIEPELTPYRCPSVNGIVERFFKTFKEECAWQNSFKSL